MWLLKVVVREQGVHNHSLVMSEQMIEEHKHYLVFSITLTAAFSSLILTVLLASPRYLIQFYEHGV